MGIQRGLGEAGGTVGGLIGGGVSAQFENNPRAATAIYSFFILIALVTGGLAYLLDMHWGFLVTLLVSVIIGFLILPMTTLAILSYVGIVYFFDDSWGDYNTYVLLNFLTIYAFMCFKLYCRNKDINEDSLSSFLWWVFAGFLLGIIQYFEISSIFRVPLPEITLLTWGVYIVTGALILKFSAIEPAKYNAVLTSTPIITFALAIIFTYWFSVVSGPILNVEPLSSTLLLSRFLFLTPVLLLTFLIISYKKYRLKKAPKSFTKTSILLVLVVINLSVIAINTFAVNNYQNKAAFIIRINNQPLDFDKYPLTPAEFANNKSTLTKENIRGYEWHFEAQNRYIEYSKFFDSRPKLSHYLTEACEASHSCGNVWLVKYIDPYKKSAVIKTKLSVSTKRKEAIKIANEMPALHWRAWVEHKETGERIFESMAEKQFQAKITKGK